MGEKTEKHLAAAFAAESKAATRNAAFALKAEAEGFPQVARLFRAVSEAESVHARRFLLLLRGKIGPTEQNLQTAFENEIRANAEGYPPMIQDASAEGQDKVVGAMSQARDVENRHAELYKKAMTDLVSERETTYFVCQVCGYVAEDQAPDKCPVCGAVKTKFKRID